jgi:two-component system, response regulator YesN
MSWKHNGIRGILGRYIVANAFLFLLPMALAGGFYAVSAKAILRAMDDLVMARLGAGMQSVERGFADARSSVANFSMDYEVNLYLNKSGPLSGIETLNLRNISRKISPMVYGNGLISHYFVYFKNSGYIAYESGFSTFESFYGPIFKEEGYAAKDWENAFLLQSDAETLRTGTRLSFEGKTAVSPIVVWPLGYGESRRGAMVGIIDGKALARVLEGLPGSYDGRGCVLDSNGLVIDYFGSGGVPDAALSGARPINDDEIEEDGLVRTIRSGKGSYRVYRLASRLTGWTFIAGLDEADVLSGARRFRDAAIGLLAAGLLLGAIAVLVLAMAQAKPLGRIFSLALERPVPERRKNLWQFGAAEDAIVALRDSRDRYQDRAMAAEDSARAYFLRRLLEGAFRDREPLEREASDVSVRLGPRSFFVLLCRLENARGLPDESIARLEAALAAQAPAILAEGEYRVPFGPGESAFIMEAGPSMRAEASRVADAAMEAAPRDLRDALAFSAGSPVDDPRLLQASLLQAKTASGRATAGSSDVLFYAVLPPAAGGLRYPIDVEESIMRAVRSANSLLLDSLVSAVLKTNFEQSLVSSAEADDLAAAMRGTATRLLHEFPAEAPGLMERMRRGSLKPEPRESILATASILGEMAELAAQRKHSRNRELAGSVKSFIERHFQSSALGIPMIAAAHRISENYLSNLYKEQEGECLSETIERVRMEAARRLLRETSQSVDKIAQACGYSSGVSFRRAFKRAAGLSPSDYRNSRGAPGEAK